MFCFGEISFENRLAQIGIKVHRLDILRLFTRGIAARPEAVPDVIMGQTRFYGIQINNAYCLVGFFIKQDVGNFGVAVNNPERQRVPVFGFFQDMAPFSTICHKFIAKGYGGGFFCRDRMLNNFIVMAQVLRGNMKFFQGVIQLVCIQIAGEAMKPANCIAGLISVRGVFYSFIGVGSGNETDDTPESAMFINKTVFAVFRGKYAWHLPSLVSSGLLMFKNVFRYNLQIMHDEFRMLKNLGVNALQDKVFGEGVQGYEKSVVDDAGAVFPDIEDFAFKIKLFSNRSRMVQFITCQIS